MKISICHYSYHRCWKEESWSCDRLAEEVKKIGADAVDFHAGLVGDPSTAAPQILTALEKYELELSGLSMSNNFNTDDPELLKAQKENVKSWLKVAAEINAPVSRIFGGHCSDRSNPDLLEAAFKAIIPALEDVVTEAERLGVVLALENHGGLPCTGEEQVKVIETINSPSLRATIDVGNYMQGGQEGHDGTAAAAKHAAYIHFKDFKKTNPPEGSRLPWGIESCTVGAGDVDHLKCLRALKGAGYEGFVAIEYEGPDDERKGVPESLAFTRNVINRL